MTSRGRSHQKRSVQPKTIASNATGSICVICVICVRSCLSPFVVRGSRRQRPTTLVTIRYELRPDHIYVQITGMMSSAEIFEFYQNAGREPGFRTGTPFLVHARGVTEAAPFVALRNTATPRYSARSAASGSARLARRAGAKLATAPTPAMKITTAEKISGSYGLT